MKKHILTVVLLCGALHHVWSQPEYRSQHYGGPGTQYAYNRHNEGFDIQQLIAGGDSVTWDFSGLEGISLSSSEILARDAALDGLTFFALCGLSGLNTFQCLNIWNMTQQAWVVQDTQILLGLPISGLQRFQRKTQDQLLEMFFGFEVDFGGEPISAAVVYASPDTVHNFPIAYGDSLSSRTTWFIDLAVTGQNIQYRARPFRTGAVDGWGTLITPYDTFTHVLRTKAVIERTDTLTTEGMSFPVDLIQVEYMWYDTNYGLPVMIAHGVILDSVELIATVEYVYEVPCAAPAWTAETDATIFELDSLGFAEVQFRIEESNAAFYLWDFGDGNTATSDGDISHVYEFPGIYTVVVTGCMADCVPLNSCTEQTLMVEVRDTTSSVIMIDGAAPDILLFPNPAHDVLNLLIPEFNGTLDFTIFDIHGRSMGSGILRSGINTINTSALNGGVYTMLFTGPEHETIRAVARFVVGSQ